MNLKLMSIIFTLSYLITILSVWIYQTEIQSYTYISIGEPNIIIKYFEWGIGIIAVRYLIIFGKKEIDEMQIIKNGSEL